MSNPFKLSPSHMDIPSSDLRKSLDEFLPDEDAEPATINQRHRGDKRIHPRDDQDMVDIDARPTKKTKNSSDQNATAKATAISSTNQPNTSSTAQISSASSSSNSKQVEDESNIPVKPKIKSNGLFWRPGPPPSSNTNSTSDDSISKHVHRNFPFSDKDFKLPPLTYPAPNQSITKTLDIPSSLPDYNSNNLSLINNNDNNNVKQEQFTYTRSDLIRYRQGKGKGPYISKDNSENDNWNNRNKDRGREKGDYQYRNLTISQGAWKKWEELGGLPNGLGDLIPYSFDYKGNPYKPDITHVQAIRLIIAASPRGKMTLSQIYQAFEERWPWHKTAGQTWRNSIRHNLSLNDCFVSVEKSNKQGGGKGGYWTVDNSLSGKTARKLKKSAPSSLSTTPTNEQNQHKISSSLNNSSESSPIAKTPNNVQVFSPITSTFTSQSSLRTKSPNKTTNDNTNTNDNDNFTTNDNKKKKSIAKPAIPYPYPYQLPKRDSNWIPNEVVQSSREIGIKRPDYDIPLDKPKSKSISGTSTTSNSNPVNSPLSSLTKNISSVAAPQHDTIQQLSSQNPESPVEVFTTRAGIPKLPMVQPKATSSNLDNNAEDHNDTLSAEDTAMVVLPNVIEAIHIPHSQNLDSSLDLPPVRISTP
ncbi:uncharacterized protein L201_004496 [Kwoniella dendrophila CBS 6074]|uniref:Fork-head domain-containing protein n=1 Tax=Kwoniella dendrophila CBS 6074 TaxID=1295534 RepID=A0AAX4JW07_9TREE